MTTNLAFTRLQPLHLRLSSFCVQAELYREIIALGGKIRQHVSYCCFNTCIVLAFALPQSRLNSSKNCFPISSLSQSFISQIFPNCWKQMTANLCRDWKLNRHQISNKFKKVDPRLKEQTISKKIIKGSQWNSWIANGSCVFCMFCFVPEFLSNLSELTVNDQLVE